MPFVIGIDLGTANIRVAVFRGGQVEFIPDEDGQILMPSCLAFSKRCRLFGGAARSQAEINPENTVYGIKPFLGKSEPRRRLEDYRAEHLSYRMERSEDREFRVKVDYMERPQRFRLVELLAMLLAKIKTNAEIYLADRVKEAVISVPSYFNAEQREHIQMAARLAYLKILCVCTSIDSIALQMYAVLEDNDPGVHVRAGRRTVAILDLGANSFNAGLVVVGDCIVQILAHASAPWLGGEAFASRIRQEIVKQLLRKYSTFVTDFDATLKYRIRAASEDAMTQLTFKDYADIRIKSVGEDYDFTCKITLDQFTSVCSYLYGEICEQIDSLFAGNGTRKCDVSEVVAVGGCSRIPGARKAWSDFFGGMTVSQEFNADMSEAYGLAVHAAIRSGIAKSGTLGKLSIRGALPASIGMGTPALNVRASLGSKVLGVVKPFMDRHVKPISSSGNRVVTTIAKRHTTLPGKWEHTFLARDLDTSLQENMLRIYEGDEASPNGKHLTGNADISSLVSFSGPETKLKIVLEIGKCFHDTRITVENLETGLRAKLIRLPVLDEQEMDFMLSKAERFQKDDDAEADRIAERDSVVLELAKVTNLDVDDCRMQSLGCLLRLLKPFCTLLGLDESLNVFRYRFIQRSIEDMISGWEAETNRCVLVEQVYAQLEEVRFELLSAPQTTKVISLLASVDSSKNWLKQYRAAKPWQYQGERRFQTFGQNSASILTPRSSASVRADTATRIELQSTPTLGRSPRRMGVERLFPKTGWTIDRRYSDAEVEEIAVYLRDTGHEDWSFAPRIYAVLRLIGHVELIDSFLDLERTDIWFPFSDSTLPLAVTRLCRSQFLKTQDVVLSKFFRLEKAIDSGNQVLEREHAHYGQGEPLPFRVIANLGGGAHGVVDKVVSTISDREYARKLFRKPGIGKREVMTFVNELQILRKISHEHCVELVSFDTISFTL